MGTYIPTDAEMTKITDFGRYYLLYTCPNCGETGLSEQRLVRIEKPDSLRVEHMPGTELNRSAPDRAPTETERDRASRGMAQKIAEGDFSALEGKVLCPRCGMVQPWSGLGKPWYRTLLAMATAFFIVAGLIGSRYLVFTWKAPALALVPAAVLVLLSLGYILRRRSRLHALRRSAEHRPAYYSPSDLRELADGPYKALVKPYLTKDRSAER